jgi:hypothetical protein
VLQELGHSLSLSCIVFIYSKLIKQLILSLEPDERVRVGLQFLSYSFG